MHKCWGRGLSAFRKFFKYPSPDAKASPSPARGEGYRLHRPWCDKILGTDCASRPRMTGGRGANPLGRSMIEMLGVLAIVGVLSVGGIAGYSQAMEKWKINKIIEEYSMLMAGLLEYKDNFIKNTPPQSEPGIVDFVQAAHLVPETWIKKSNINMSDSLGNHVGIYFSSERNANGYDVGDRFVFNLYFGRSNTSDNSFQYNLCRTFFKDLGVAMSYNMLAMGMIPVAQNTNYAGDSWCHGGLGYNGETRKCLRDMTLTEISDICKTCQTTNCGVVFVF